MAGLADGVAAAVAMVVVKASKKYALSFEPGPSFPGAARSSCSSRQNSASRRGISSLWGVLSEKLGVPEGGARARGMNEWVSLIAKQITKLVL